MLERKIQIFLWFHQSITSGRITSRNLSVRNMCEKELIHAVWRHIVIVSAGSTVLFFRSSPPKKQSLDVPPTSLLVKHQLIIGSRRHNSHASLTVMHALTHTSFVFFARYFRGDRYFARYFRSLVEIREWNISQVTSMMFHCYSLRPIPFSYK